MIGGHFAGHPWNAGGEHGFVVHEPEHRVAAMFPPRFRWRDEIYQYDPRYQPENLRVLVSLDMAASSPKHPWQVPVSWVRDYGKGRVYYTNFGHNEATWNDPVFQEHAAEGIAWALGRFDAPAEPNPEAQAAEYLRSVLAAAAEQLSADHDALRAKADAKIAADSTWAAGLRPLLLPLRGMKPADRKADLREPDRGDRAMSRIGRGILMVGLLACLPFAAAGRLIEADDDFYTTTAIGDWKLVASRNTPGSSLTRRAIAARRAASPPPRRGPPP